MPEDGSSTIITVLGTVAGLITAFGGAWALYKKTQSDSKQTAATTAQTTVQSTLDAMKMVVEGLTRELDRRQVELDRVRDDLLKAREHERELEILSSRQETRIAVLEAQHSELKRRLDTLEGQQRDA